MNKALDELTRFHWHEALDRTHLIETMVSEHLAKHPVIRYTPHFKLLTKQIGDLLGILYQEIGSNDPYWDDSGEVSDD